MLFHQEIKRFLEIVIMTQSFSGEPNTVTLFNQRSLIDTNLLQSTDCSMPEADSQSRSTTSSSSCDEALELPTVPTSVATMRADLASTEALILPKYTFVAGKNSGTLQGHGSLIIDSVPAFVGALVLIMHEADAKRNGLYIVKENSGVRHQLVRINPRDETIVAGTLVFVQGGTVNSKKVFMLEPKPSVTSDRRLLILNRDPLHWTLFDKPQATVVGTPNRTVVHRNALDAHTLEYSIDIHPYLMKKLKLITAATDNGSNPGVSDHETLIAESEVTSIQLDMTKKTHIGDTSLGALVTTPTLSSPGIADRHIFLNTRSNPTGVHYPFKIDFGNIGLTGLFAANCRYMTLLPGDSVMVIWTGHSWQHFNNGCTFSND